MIKQKDPKKRGKASRNKGAEAERTVAKRLQKLGHSDARRGQVFNHEPDIVGVPGVHIEVKNQDELVIHKAWQQSLGAAKKDEIPVVIYKRGDRQPWMLLMRFDDYEELKERL